MDNLFSLWKVREIADKVTNVVMNYTEIEAKVREATNDEAWGPTGALMQELAHATFTYEHFPEVMSMLWKRMLQDSKQHWRRTYKALLVLNYLVRNGSERVVTSSREHIYDLRSLENYTFIDDNGKDQGVNIRHKVKDLIDFIQDDDRLREERKKAKKNKDKYIGMSSDMMGMRFGGSEKWDERPYTRNEFADQEWDDPSTNRYRDKSREEEDDRDNIDSDEETSGRIGKTSNTIKYKDDGKSENFQSSNTIQSEKRIASLSLNSGRTDSPKRTQKPIKKVDLGAAANFGRDATQSPLPRPPSGGGLDLLDDFDPRAEEKAGANSTNEFGEFEAAFKHNTATPLSNAANDEGFADFGSAFSTSNSTAPPSLLSSPNNPTVLPSIIPSSLGVSNQNLLVNQPIAQVQPSNPLQNPLHNEPFGGVGSLYEDLGKPSQTFGTSTVQQPIPGNKNENDLLSDLSNFGLSTTPNLLVGNGNNNNINYGLSHNAGLLDNLDGGLLSPTVAAPLQPMSSSTNNTAAVTSPQSTKTNQAMGSTWVNSGNVNIDLDNLMISKPKLPLSPSMNEMASNPTSPINRAKIGNNSISNVRNNFNNIQDRIPQQNPNFFSGFK
ncbi:clathrin interactor 1 isoform X2 [Sitophilus oryzae]|uniref:Clathrin interactor 1 isoform X2 n=1 Tax=Sitophilus oryzae TaxID=7048 RepID=A0A6J2XGP1_SITOR|nr:clathrin interactor 1 isoform X2 [Sitophilus oryzae]